jgi:hypothetical protein
MDEYSTEVWHMSDIYSPKFASERSPDLLAGLAQVHAWFVETGYGPLHHLDSGGSLQVHDRHWIKVEDDHGNQFHVVTLRHHDTVEEH